MNESLFILRSGQFTGSVPDWRQLDGYLGILRVWVCGGWAGVLVHVLWVWVYVSAQVCEYSTGMYRYVHVCTCAVPVPVGVRVALRVGRVGSSTVEQSTCGYSYIHVFSLTEITATAVLSSTNTHLLR